MPTPLEALMGVPNAAEPLPNLLTGGQPSAAHFEALGKAGVQVVLDIRDRMEPRPFDERALVERLGMKYHNISVTGATLDDETLELVLAVVRENRDRPLLFHCASGNRVAGAMIPILMLDEKMPEDRAVESAMRMGLRGADILQWGLDYSQRHQSG